MRVPFLLLASCVLTGAAVSLAEAAAPVSPVASPALLPSASYPEARFARFEDFPLPRSRWEVGMNMGYGFCAAPDSEFSTDMFGVELEGAYHFHSHQALTLAMGFAGGGEDRFYWVLDEKGAVYPFTHDYDRSNFYLMAGYRADLPLGKRVSLSLGARCGLDVQRLGIDYGPGWRGGWGYGYDDSDTAAGWGYAAYAKVTVALTPQSSLEVGYQFRGSTTQPKAGWGYWGGDEPPHTAADLRWHEVRVGFRFHF